MTANDETKTPTLVIPAKGENGRGAAIIIQGERAIREFELWLKFTLDYAEALRSLQKEYAHDDE